MIREASCQLDYLREMPEPPRQTAERYPNPIPDASPLIGIKRSRVEQGLGKPGGCIDRDGNASRTVECSGADEWWYPFYRLPPRTLGGGVELVLSFDDSGHCVSARWLHSQ